MKALELLTTGNSDVFQVMTMTLFVSLAATVISVLLGLPLGLWLALVDFAGKQTVTSIVRRK